MEWCSELYRGTMCSRLLRGLCIYCIELAPSEFCVLAWLLYYVTSSTESDIVYNRLLNERGSVEIQTTSRK